MKRVFLIQRSNPRWAEVITSCGRAIREWIAAGREVVVTLAEPTRTNEINAAMWCVLADLSKQVGWVPARWRGDRCVREGYYALLVEEPTARRLTDEEFKDVITAAYRKPRLVGGIDGGVVAVGMRTSRMSQAQIRDVIAIAEAFGSELGVEWTPAPATGVPSEYAMAVANREAA